MVMWHKKMYLRGMKQNIPVMSVTGSDNTGFAGVQADIRTISALGARAVTAITSITVQDAYGIQSIHDLPTSMVAGQTKAVFNDVHPRAVKVGMVRDAETVRALRNEIIGCRKIVLVPGILSSHGERLLSDAAIEAWKSNLIPEASLLILKCSEAELLLGMTVATNDDMVRAAERLVEMGAQAVMLRGGHQTEGMLTAILYAEGQKRFFSSHNTEGWQKHGVAGVFSTAVATRMAMGDDVFQAVANAHAYVHSQVVYSVTAESRLARPADIYNRFMSIIAENYKSAHDVAFYAGRLSITTRYLCQVTDKAVGKSPKQIIAEYIMHEAVTLLENSRLTIQEISDSLGFSSQAMFSKFFRNNCGKSPTQVRKDY